MQLVTSSSSFTYPPLLLPSGPHSPIGVHSRLSLLVGALSRSHTASSPHAHDSTVCTSSRGGGGEGGREGGASIDQLLLFATPRERRETQSPLGILLIISSRACPL